MAIRPCCLKLKYPIIFKEEEKMNYTFAKRMDRLKGSAVRELMALTARPEVISFAGGMPAPELFPVEKVKEACVAMLDEMGQKALQYAPTEGYIPLREQIVKRMEERLHIKTDIDHVLVTSGSQQGLDFSARVFLNPGDVILVESPSYVGALNAFNACEPTYVEVPTDDYGMIPEELERILETTENVKLIYVIPDFQNPSGKTWSMKRREHFMALINKYEIPVIEDNPYGDLRFEGEYLPSLKSMDTKDLVIFLGTLSKVFCPGLRIGWVCAPAEILAKYNFVKQGADLQVSSFDQMLASKFMDLYDLNEHVEKIKAVYKVRRDLMLKTMEETFPEGVTWTVPEGGLFTWVTLPEGVDATEIAPKLLEQNVAYVPGASFYPYPGKENHFRMNYSNATEENLVIGVKRIGAVLTEILSK